METSETSPAEKEFCVWADCNRQVYQHVTAASPEEAHAIASEQDDDWEYCDDQDWHRYSLSGSVLDIESGELIDVADPTAMHCKTCDREITEAVNDTNFRDGECGPCEHARYLSQPVLRRHLERLIEMSESVVASRGNGNALAEAVDSLERIVQEAKTAVTHAHGKAA